MSDVGKVNTLFEKHYGQTSQHSAFTPGRVNIIGEHTDYNGGHVLPSALPLGLTIALSQRSDTQMHLVSDKFEAPAVRNLRERASDHWSDYALGALILAKSEGLIDSGVNLAIETTLPFGAGLSSSAAITVGILKLLDSSNRMPNKDIATLARRVENEFIGMPCGIMDQMAVAIASPGQALSLDTRSLDYELIDLPDGYDIAVIHSGVFRRLAEGRYKDRKEECDAVKQALGQDHICLITDSEYSALNTLSETLRRRARHCMTEHRRTLRAVSALASKDCLTLGKLMTESHISMRDDFEISLPEIDALVDDATALGATGARLTGGGFGGCIVACIESSRRESWSEALLIKHPKAFIVC